MMHNNLQEILSKQKDIICFTGANDEQIASISQKLLKNNIPSIPESYINFLKTSNGLSFDGIELFGTEDIPREEKKYIFPSLFSSNQDFSNYEFFINKLIIGITSENFIIYDSETKKYSTIDAISLHTLEEFSDIKDLLSYLLKPYKEISD